VGAIDFLFYKAMCTGSEVQPANSLGTQVLWRG